MQNAQNFTLEELLAEKQRRTQAKAGQAKQTPDIASLLKSASPSAGQSIANAMSVLGAGKPVYEQGGVSGALGKLYAQEAIKSQFEDPTVRQLREAEIAALQTPPPQGFVRIGRQIQPDPNYVKPMDQAKLDEEARVRNSESESIRSTAEQNLASIEQSKKGAKFFGPLGNLPSIAAPSSLLGMGDYPERKTWENNINQLLSQKVVDLIAEMKRVSKTGATGFGQLSEREGAILREASTALSKDLPPEQAVYYLNEMEKINKKILGENQSQGIQSSQPQQQGIDIRSQYNTLRSQGVSADDAKRQLGL